MEKEKIEGLLNAISKIRTGLQDIEGILVSMQEAEMTAEEVAVETAALEEEAAEDAAETAALEEVAAEMIAEEEAAVEVVAEEAAEEEEEIVIEPAFETEATAEPEPESEAEPEIFPIARNTFDPSRPWMEGLCGPAISNVFSAMFLNDRILYTKELFGGDSDEFHACMDKLNAASSMEEAESFVFEKYHWDRKDPNVCRLMMTVRRRFNKI